MDWTEYTQLLAEFKERAGGKPPPSMYTEQGAIDYMKDRLAELPAPAVRAPSGIPKRKE